MEPNSSPRKQYIKWIDHSGFAENGWKADEELYSLEPFIVESMGFVIKETETYLVLVAHYADQAERGCGEMCILKNCIVEQKEIEV